MPKALHAKLKRDVERLHPNWSQERKDAWVYSTLDKIEKLRKQKRK